MSVVAGCSLFNGVLLAADCRVTIQHPDRSDVYVDTAQKLFPLAPGVALGFVGNLEVAAYLLRTLFDQIPRRHRRDPVSLSLWLPRFFKAAYAKLLPRLRNRNQSITFLVGSVLDGERNVIDREIMVHIFRKSMFGETALRMNSYSALWVQIFQTPPECRYIELPGTSHSVLYVMRSPNFEIEPYPPLQFVAIGSGETVMEEIALYHEAILEGSLSGFPDPVLILRDAISDFIQERKIQSVGGLYPVLKVSGHEIVGVGMLAETPIGGTLIQLTMRNDRWVQRNLITGKEIELLPPWAVSTNATQDRVFDDFVHARRRIKNRI
jgi:hypothetical protein